MTESTQVGFLQSSPLPVGSQAVESDRAVAEIKAMVAVAHMKPRDEARAVDKVLNACTRISLAETARYTYSRGGTEITGPTIRLAEAIAQYWGNITWGWKEIERRLDTSVCRAYAWDIENNVRREADFIVPHYRDTRNGRKSLKDDRDIYELCANMAMRRVRACLLNIIPADVTEMAEKACDATLANSEPVTDESRKKLLEAFSGYGVTRAMIEKRLGRSIDAMTAGQQVGLRRVFAGLKDGMGVVSDYFAVEEAAKEEKPKTKGVEALKAALVQPESPVVAEEPKPEPQPEALPIEELVTSNQGAALSVLTDEEIAELDAADFARQEAERQAIENGETIIPDFMKGR